MKKTVVVVLVVLCCLLGACSSPAPSITPSPTPEPTAAPTATPTPSPTPSPVPTLSSESSSESEGLSPDALVTFVIAFISDSSIKEASTVSYDHESTSVVINIVFDGAAFSAQKALNGTTVDRQKWEDLCNAMADFGGGIKNGIDILHCPENVVVFLNNDLNPDNLLCAVLNGNIVYDVTKE